MFLKLIEAPETEPVTIKQAVRHLNEYEEPGPEPGNDGPESLETEEEPAEAEDETVETYTLEDHIADLIATARESCEEYQNRAYLTQTWELWLDAWLPVITLPRPPLQSVESICWYDREHQAHTIDPADYFADTNSEPGRVFPLKPWPAGVRAAGGICITFKAGHDEEAKVPRRVRQAILLLVAEWYLNREATSLTGKSGAEKFNREIPFGVTRLLDYDRVMPV
jgi:uncharacterized phiE125 gp8 family phage protein